MNEQIRTHFCVLLFVVYSVCVTLLFRFLNYGSFALSRDLPKTKNR